jgi:plasmid maintenance system antidote protein VapI
MKEMTEIRKLNLEKMSECYGSQVALASVLNSTTARISHLLTGYRNIGEKTARKFELLLQKPLGWMDSLHDEPFVVSQNIIDLSKYNDDQRRLIAMLLNSFDSLQLKENTQNKPLATTTENGGGQKSLAPLSTVL